MYLRGKSIDMISAVIIDDVASARSTLRADLETYCPEVTILGEAEGVVSGAKLLREHSPDVVFLDIQMQDGTGFDLLEILGDIDFKLIFTTASDEHAIKAFRFSAIDYLLKPVDPDLLVEAVQKVRGSRSGQSASVKALLDNIQPQKAPSRLALNTLEKIHVVKLDDIFRCESSANYTIFHLRNGRQLLVTKTLKEFERMLEDHDYIRVHQSHLVNAAFISEFVKVDGGYIVMTDGSQVPVSSRKRSSVMQRIANL
ncbi:MAG: LytTR family DNA-binding domain-containing protein [Bacteroidota bacterium]